MTMIILEKIRHQVAVAGTVSDGRTGAAIHGARVAIVTGPPAFTHALALKALRFGAARAGLEQRPDRTRTAGDGHFHFLDLPAGNYTLKASLPEHGSRYGAARIDITVSHDDAGTITMATADMRLSPTTIAGRISDKTTGEAIALALVRIQGSGERAFADARGRYRLIGVEAGPRTLVVSARGYGQSTKSVTPPQAGAVVEDVNFTLEAG